MNEWDDWNALDVAFLKAKRAVIEHLATLATRARSEALTGHDPASEYDPVAEGTYNAARAALEDVISKL